MTLPPPPNSAPPASALPRPTPGAQGLARAWQGRGPGACALWPVSQLYGAVVALRRQLYARGWLASSHPGRPVIVVGNVIAGGAGKTPVVIALVQHLRAQGWRPGVISRGYGRSSTECLAVTAHSRPQDAGDEPTLIARSCPGLPLFVASTRSAAAAALLAAHPDTDVLICDDGLQHLALQRDLEICIFNDQGVGNGWLLPAGPLREPWPRAVDAVLHAGPAPAHSPPSATWALQRTLADHAVRADGSRVALSALQGQPLHAVAAVARPHDFFTMLQARGLTLASTQALPDHYNFESYEASKHADKQLICTEKDAVKLWQRFPQALAVPLVLQLAPEFFAAIDARLQALTGKAPQGAAATAAT